MKSTDGIIPRPNIRKREFTGKPINNTRRVERVLKLIVLLNDFKTIKEIKNLVDKVYEIFGKDSLECGKFSTIDLELMETEEMFTLKTWFLTYFDLHIGFIHNDNGDTSYILVKEK